MERHKGLIVVSEEGQYLSDVMTWKDHDRPEKACVHSPINMALILMMSGDWRFSPEEVILANREEDKGVEVLGDRETIPRMDELEGFFDERGVMIRFWERTVFRQLALLMGDSS